MSTISHKPVLPKQIDLGMIEQTIAHKHPRSHHEVVKMRDVYKKFKVGGAEVPVLKHITVTFYSGEFVMIFGPSGCGKSTFLHTMLGLEEPNSGKVFLRDADLYSMSHDDRATFRHQKIGMIFQQSNWIKSLSVVENVAYPLMLSGASHKEAGELALERLHEVGMDMHARQRPTELSGGQQQKVALARALVTNPWIIVADEPTGNLDTRSGYEVVHMLAWLNRVKRRMIVMVTHDNRFLNIATRRIHMTDGAIISDEHDH